MEILWPAELETSPAVLTSPVSWRPRRPWGRGSSRVCSQPVSMAPPVVPGAGAAHVSVPSLTARCPRRPWGRGSSRVCSQPDCYERVF